jgi:hypothetical protein
MSHWRRDLLEFISPGRMRQSAIPPLEAGFRPNSRLDEAPVRETFPPLTIDDVALLDGRVAVTAGRQVLQEAVNGFELVTEVSGSAGALASTPSGLAAAVVGHGIVEVTPDGTTRLLCGDKRLRSCVTAVSALDDGSLLDCIGSTTTDDWARNLVSGTANGLLLRVNGESVEELATDLPWPSGVVGDGSDGFFLSVSDGHRIEHRSLADPRKARTVLGNLPGYPGRIAAADGDEGWWAAMPYMRNRATELLLKHEDLLEEMVSHTAPESWLVPRLAIENIYRAPLQVGQIRVFGEIKPWAPPRTYGLTFRFSEDGRVLDSAHSRADGVMHGVTGVQPMPGGSVVLALRGAGAVVTLGAGSR